MTARIAAALRAKIRRAAGDRCGYCLAPQTLVWGEHEIEHIIPTGRGGSDEESNLWLACAGCNSYKQARTEALDPESESLVPLFNPRTQVWREHFGWTESGARIEGLTATGRATVVALHLNVPHRVQLRRLWIKVGWHPAEDADSTL